MKNEVRFEKLLLRTKDVAIVLSMSERKVWSLAQSGELPSFKQGRSRFFSKSSIVAWIDGKLEGGFDGANQ